LNIRPLAHPDLDALLALYTHLHQQDDPLPDRGIVESAWLESVQNPRMRHFGGFEGDELVAACTICVVPNLTRGCRPYAVIENVVTAAGHRRKGWGRAVLSEALGFAWSQGCYKVMLLTGRSDDGVLCFYQAAGFDPGEKRAFIARPVQ
jgi:GNAT superfamily N-acetyltransferase